MALGLLVIMFAILILISALAVFVLFFKGGHYVKKTWVYAFVQAFIILLSILYISSLPENFIINRVMGGILICIALFNTWFKVKNFKISRIISAVLIFAALALLFS